MALKSDGTVWVWGLVYHLYGGSVTVATPTQVSGLNGVTAIAAGQDQYVALRSDGTVWGWGYMYLGNGSYGGSDTPGQVMTGVASISAGGSHNLAVKSDGTVWAWGSNLKGELGNGSNTNSMTPVQVSGLGGVSAAAGGGAGEGYSLALKTNGTVWAWGSNRYGQLGNGTTTDNPTAGQVAGISGASAIAAGEGQSLAIVGGAVKAWGYNGAGQLGDGSTTNRSYPVSVVGLGGVTSISGGGVHTLALKSDGTRWSWGGNSSYELANGSTVSSSTPVQSDPLVVQPATCGFKSTTSISAGAAHSIALKSDGTAWAWGDNSRGQLGNATTTSSSRPSQVSLSNVTAVSAGGGDSAALTSDGKVWIWGDNASYGLGRDNVQTPYSSTPLQVAGIPTMTAVAVNGSTTFALSSDGTVWGWGYSFGGALGPNTQSPWSPPIQIQYVTGIAVISSGPMALRADGTVLEWGNYGTSSTLGLDSVRAIAYPGARLAVRCDGSVWAWGDNTYGQLGLGNTTPVNGVQRVLNAPSFAGVSGGPYHSLALNVDGSMRSWGYNNYGQLGDGTKTSRYLPVGVSGVSNIVSIAGGYYHSLALRADGTVVSWGRNDAGQLGNGTTNDSSTPSDSLMSGVLQPTILNGPAISELYGGNNPSEKQCTCTSTQQPVSDATGDFFHTFTDISIPGRGLPLNFQRTYNSLSASQNGPFGYGWTSSYGSSLTVDGSGNVTIAQENGSTVNFANSGGVYTPPSRVLATLVKNGDGTYTFKREDQTKYQFSASGQLIAESDRNGYTTTLSYTGGLLTSITDPGGRSLTLTYTGSLVTHLASSTGRSVSYQYLGSDLQQVTDVNGGFTNFTYYAGHTMQTMTDPNGGVVTNVFDGSGRVTSQTDPMLRLTTFDYSTVGQTKITDPKGNVTVESYSNNLLMSRTRGYGTSQAASWQYTYDPATLGSHRSLTRMATLSATHGTATATCSPILTVFTHPRFTPTTP